MCILCANSTKGLWIHTHSYTHSPKEFCSNTLWKSVVIGWDEARGRGPKQETGIPRVLDCGCRPSHVLQQHIRLLHIREQPIQRMFVSLLSRVCLVIHRTSLWLIRRESCGIKWQSPPSQLDTAVHQLGCHSYWLLSWRRAHPLLPVPARHRRHWLAEAAPVLARARGEVSAFVWRVGWKLCVWVCVNRTVNAADFLVCVIQQGAGVRAGARAGCSGATGWCWEGGLTTGDLQTGQALWAHRPLFDICFWLRATDGLLRYMFLPSGFAVAPAVAPAWNDPLGVFIFQCVYTGRSLPWWCGRDGGHSEKILCQIISWSALIQRVRVHSLLQTHTTQFSLKCWLAWVS